MRKLLLLTACMLLVAAPAYATHGSQTLFVDNGRGVTWGALNDFDLCLSGEWADLPGTRTTGTEKNFLDSSEEALNEILFGSQFPDNAWQANWQGSYCGNFNFKAEYPNYANFPTGAVAFCDQLPPVGNRNSSVQYEDLNDIDLLATTVTCDRNGNGDIDYFVIIFNTECEQVGCGDFAGDFSFHETNNPGSLDYDYRGTLVHELGHAVGFDAHLNGDCSETPSTWNTMCSHAQSGYGNFNRDNGSDFGTYDRSLDSHDLGAISQQY